jgi:hypothetical protein
MAEDQSELIRLFRAFRDALAKGDRTEARAVQEQLITRLEQFKDLSDDLVEAYNVVLTKPTVAALDEIFVRLNPPAAFLSWDWRDEGPKAADLLPVFAALGIHVYDAPRNANSDPKGWVLSRHELGPAQIERAFTSANPRDSKGAPEESPSPGLLRS